MILKKNYSKNTKHSFYAEIGIYYAVVGNVLFHVSHCAGNKF